jgi:hypothetical protein
MTQTPDTLDLADRGAAAINALTGPLDPAYNYEMYFTATLSSAPPEMQHESTGLAANNPKFLESLPRMRVVSGSEQALEIERGLVRGLGNSAATDSTTPHVW